MFKPVDLDGHGLNQSSAKPLGHLVEVGGSLGDFFLGRCLGFALKGQALRHQGFEGLAALGSGLGLSLRHGTQTR